jgi:hypothetical protein
MSVPDYRQPYRPAHVHETRLHLRSSPGQSVELGCGQFGYA